MVYLVAVVVGIEAGDQSEMCFGSQSSKALGQRGKSTLPRTLGQPCQQSGPGDILLQHDPMNNHQVFGKLHSLLHTWLWDEEETPPFFLGNVCVQLQKLPTIQLTLSYLKTLHVYIPIVPLSGLGRPCPWCRRPQI